MLKFQVILLISGACELAGVWFPDVIPGGCHLQRAGGENDQQNKAESACLLLF